MQTSFAGDTIEWGSLLPPSDSHIGGAFHQLEWEVSSSTDSNNSNNNNNNNNRNINDSEVLRKRIGGILSQWDEKVSEVILKWGSMGVKSNEYIRVMHRKNIEKKQKDDTREFMKRKKLEKRIEQKRREERARMAANAWARRKDAAKEAELILTRNYVPVKEPRPPSSSLSNIVNNNNNNNGNSSIPPIRHRHLLAGQIKNNKAAQSTPILRVSVEENSTDIYATNISDISAINNDKLSVATSGKILDIVHDKSELSTRENQEIIKTPLKELPSQSIANLSASSKDEKVAPPIIALPVIVEAKEQTEVNTIITSSQDAEKIVGGFNDGSFELSGIIVKETVPIEEENTPDIHENSKPISYETNNSNSGI